jgi:hypothetical protein
MMRRSQLLSAAEFSAMLRDARILEQDERGIKVMRLASGDMLKVFRVRGRFSIARIYSYARRFCSNAARLRRLGIPTVEVKQLFHLETPAETAVLYTPLAGETLRERLERSTLTADELYRLGSFVALLHRHGVHFRSLHLGNIVLCADGGMGLIDIADMRIYPWPLWCMTRCRNFNHLHREQIRALGEAGWLRVEDSYFANAGLSSACERRIRDHLRKISAFPAE